MPLLALGLPVVPFYLSFFGGGSPTKIDYRKESGTLTLSSLLEDLANHDLNLDFQLFAGWFSGVLCTKDSNGLLGHLPMAFGTRVNSKQAMLLPTKHLVDWRGFSG